MSSDNKFDGDFGQTYYIASTGFGGTHFANDIADKAKEHHDCKSSGVGCPECFVNERSHRFPSNSRNTP